MQKLEPQYILGVDISNHQGHVDMSQWHASGIRFIYAKASEGTSYVDPFFAGNVQKANAAGIPIGAYHFARTSVNAPIDEAHHFLTCIKSATGDFHLPLDCVLDLEDTDYKGSPDQLVRWVNTFADYVRTQTGRDIILYTGGWYAPRFGGGLTKYRLWSSYYPADALLPHLGDVVPPSYAGWDKYTMWQFRSDGTLAGVSGRVDLNYAVSLEAMGYVQKTKLTQAQEDACEVIRMLQSNWRIAASDAHRDAVHTAADAIRDKYNLHGVI